SAPPSRWRYTYGGGRPDHDDVPEAPEREPPAAGVNPRRPREGLAEEGVDVAVVRRDEERALGEDGVQEGGDDGDDAVT
uniref:Uncharacterized protein n=1 Tax=Oryza rufipogon TaxID=4529 RepID=A0A0E0ND06_ORYRU